MELSLQHIEAVERIATLVELGRLDDASREFFSSDCHGALVQALNSQQPRHLNNPAYRHLYGLLQSLAQIKPNPRGPAGPEKIRSYCQDIRELYRHLGDDSTTSEPAEPVEEVNAENKESAPGSADSADKKKVFPRGIPDDPVLLALGVVIHEEQLKPKKERRSKNAIAREYEAETGQNAETLLRTLRRFQTGR